LPGGGQPGSERQRDGRLADRASWRTECSSLLTAAGWAGWLVIGLPAGACADRLPARQVMVACDIISAVLYQRGRAVDYGRR
jgi:hypothetical protein